MMRSLVFVVVSSIPFVHSQATWFYSGICTDALQDVLSDPDASKCLNADTFSAVMSITSDPSSTKEAYQAATNTWLTGFCNQPVCSDDTIAAIVKKTLSACAEARGGERVSDDDEKTIKGAAEEMQKYFPSYRKELCLKNGPDFCYAQITGQATNAYLNGLSLPFSGVISAGAEHLPGQFLCSDCMKARQNVISETYPDVTQRAKKQDEKDCGADFVDGSWPTSITQAAVGESASTRRSVNNAATLASTSSTSSSTPSTTSSASGSLSWPLRSFVAAWSFVYLLTVF